MSPLQNYEPSWGQGAVPQVLHIVLVPVLGLDIPVHLSRMYSLCTSQVGDPICCISLGHIPRIPRMQPQGLSVDTSQGPHVSQCPQSTISSCPPRLNKPHCGCLGQSTRPGQASSNAPLQPITDQGLQEPQTVYFNLSSTNS